jgi:hypothetical protein
MRALVGAVVLLGACAGLAPVVPQATLPGPAPPSRVPLTVVAFGGDRPALGRAIAERLGKSVDAVVSDPPRVTDVPPANADVETAVAEARQLYVDADFPGCRRRVDGAALVPALLAEGRRALAARVLLWRVACRVGEGDLDGARPDARALAAYALEVPTDVTVASPEVEAVLAEARRELGAEAPVATKITARGRGGPLAAAVTVDGRGPICTTPCSIDLSPADHVIAVEADLFVPASRVARPGAVELTLDEAPPELAARQWTARFAGGREIDTDPSVRLLSRASRARHLAVLRVEEGRVTGALAVDDRVVARGERFAAKADLPAAGAELLRSLLVSGKLLEPAPPVWRRPLFWVAVGGVALLTGGITALLLYEPSITTKVIQR